MICRSTKQVINRGDTFLFSVQYNQMFNMWRAREKVVAAVGADVVLLSKENGVACLSNGVTAEVDNARRRNFKQFGYNVSV